MEHDSNKCFETYSGFEVVSRKNKKKRRQRKNLFLTSEELKNETECPRPLESGAEVTDENGSDVESDDVSKDLSIMEENCAQLGHALAGQNRVSTDAMLKAPPSISLEEETNPDKQIVYGEIVKQVNMEDNKEINGEPELPEYVTQSFAPSLINTKALSKDASTYELERFKKNAMIIFNQENIDGHNPRLGTRKDVEALKQTFGKFGFEVDEHKDFTKDKVLAELKTFSERNFTEYGCVAVVVLTHGTNNGLLRAKDQQYSEIEIINYFKVLNKPTLVTKPKIIIIQACRGTKIMPGVPVFHSGKVRKDLDEDLEPYILPVESDILILHSSYGGSPSHRNELHGSWFIQELCSKINSLAPTNDLESIIVEVKRAVAINKQHEEYNKKTFEIEVNKQMPVMTSTLIRKLFLRKYGDATQDGETFTDAKQITCESRDAVLDNAVPSSPLLVQYGPCSCFLDHFVYMRECLRHFVESHPDDVTARNYMILAESFEEGVEFYRLKEKMSKAISEHLLNNARDCEYYKYLYFYNK